MTENESGVDGSLHRDGDHVQSPLFVDPLAQQPAERRPSDDGPFSTNESDPSTQVPADAGRPAAAGGPGEALTAEDGEPRPQSGHSANGEATGEYVTDRIRALGALPVPRIIAMANQKGGVGKTTTTLSLGASLAEAGRRVLLVDFDPQGGCSIGLGINPNSLELTVYNLLLQGDIRPSEVIIHSRLDGLDVAPANIDLAVAELMLVGEVAREQALRRVLDPLRADYDYILIDCPPSLGLLTVNALTAADTVIIPLECEYFAMRGMSMLLDTVEKVTERLNPELKVEGILATMYDARTLHAREVLERVREAFGSRLFETVIPKTIRFAEAPVAGEPIVTYAPASPGAVGYRKLAQEVMQA